MDWGHWLLLVVLVLSLLAHVPDEVPRRKRGRVTLEEWHAMLAARRGQGGRGRVG